jgi:hypothetical protein
MAACWQIYNKKNQFSAFLTVSFCPLPALPEKSKTFAVNIF